MSKKKSPPRQTVPHDVPLSSFSGRWLAMAAIVCAGMLAYSDSFQGPFVFDDVRSIPDNPDIRSLWPLSTVLGSTRSATVIGRPLLSLSLAISYALHGNDVRGYHVFSLTVHQLCGLVLFGVLRQAFLLPKIPERWRQGATGRAAVVALLWSVHPLASSTVLYMVQRAELLAGLAYLLTLYAVLRSVNAERPGIWQLAAVLCCAAGVATKETVATAPLAALLIDRCLISSSWREVFTRRGKLYAGLASTWILLGGLVAFSHGRQGSAGFGSGMSPWHYLLTQFEALVIYAKLCFWPQPLIFDYGFNVAHSPAEVWWQMSLVLLAFAGTLYLTWRRPEVGLPALLFFLILGPTSSFVPLISHTIAEHRMYLPLAMLLLLAVLACESLLVRNVRPIQQQIRLRIALVVAVLMAAVLVSLTHRRARDYETALALWRDTAQKRPQNARARSNFGSELANSNKLELARPEFEAAIRLEPENVSQNPNRGYFAEAHENLGNYLLRTKQPRQAAAAFTEALRVSPDRPQYQLWRAQARGQLGDFDGAVADCTATIEALPEYAEAYQQRAIALLQLKQYDRAWSDVQKFERLGGKPHPLLLKQLSVAMPRPSNPAP